MAEQDINDSFAAEQDLLMAKEILAVEEAMHPPVTATGAPFVVTPMSVLRYRAKRKAKAKAAKASKRKNR